MGIIDRLLGREKREAPGSGTVSVSDSNFLAFFGIDSAILPHVTVDTALQVPAFSAAVTFLSGSMANLPLHVFKERGKGSDKAGGPVQRIINEAPNSEWTSYGWRKYMWHQVFTQGRGLSWIERDGAKIHGIWPFEPGKTVIERRNGRKVYKYDGKEYPAEDVIDVPFLLKADQLSSYSPVVFGAKAIQLSIAMGDYASNFFAGGGVPPLAMVGPLPAGAEAMKRAQEDVARAIKAAKDSSKPIFPMPSGYDLKPVGFDPEKGQMTDARRFQVEEIARLYNLPPVFLQDLTHGTFSNTEQQDLHLVKHVITQWAKAFEEELTLKLFRGAGTRYVEHSLDGLQRGDFKTRMDGLSTAVQNALLTPNEARALENRPPDAEGDSLMIQGATVPLGQQKVQGDLFNKPANQNVDNTNEDGADAA